MIWHDLAVCYLYHAISTEDEGKVQQLFSYAMAAAQYCTSTNPSNWQHWNLLGIVAMKKSKTRKKCKLADGIIFVFLGPPSYTLAQHVFIKALNVDRNSAVVWTNLGILYLLVDDIKLANKAFAQGQRSDPNYVNSWIGQVYIYLACEFILK